MGANTSRHRYEYSYDDPARDYYMRSRAMGYAHGPPYYGQQAGVMSAYPPVMYPVAMQPMQQISGPPVGLPQQQPVTQMPQPQVPSAFINPPVIPSNLAPSLSVPQMPQPQMQPGVMPQPQPQHPFSPGPPAGMPEAAVQQGAGMPGITPVIPQSFARRVPSDSTSDYSSSSDSRRRRRRRRRRRSRSMDPLERNPLPVPPREVDAPDDILAGTAMAPRGPSLPRPPSPLENPLPPPPRDVYTLRKYRPLLVGTAYADRKKDVYPKDWFEDEDWSDREGGLGRVFERLNPFRPHRNGEFSPRHRRSETMPVLPDFPDFVRQSSGSGSEDTYASPGERRPGVGRSFSSFLPFRHRRQENETVMPMPTPGQGQPPLADGQAPPSGFMPMPSPAVAGPMDHPQSAHPFSPVPPQAQPVNPLNPALQPANPLTPGLPQRQPVIPLSPMPQSQTMSMPQPQTMGPMTPGPPQPVNPLTPGPSQGMSMPTPARPLSPMLPPVVAGEGPRSPNSHSDSTLPQIVFNQDTPGYGGLTHLSQHNVLYKGKLYPTAAHLFEAFRFLGRHNKLAKRVREAETHPELNALLQNIGQYTRPDWEEVLVEKMENALYHKIVQHRDLSDMLLGTGEAELTYDDPPDWFWGEGEEGEGRNELGRALMRIRDRMRREQADHEHR